jgi:hypothetical protein
MIPEQREELDLALEANDGRLGSVFRPIEDGIDSN